MTNGICIARPAKPKRAARQSISILAALLHGIRLKNCTFEIMVIPVLTTVKSAVKRALSRRWPISYAKSGEDLQLMQLLKTSKGFYVDVGCWHPVKASNTYLFYLRGWRGICIDPNPSLVHLYAQYRPNDLLVSAAISQDASGTYHIWQEGCSSMNSMDTGFVAQHQKSNQPIQTLQVPTITLAALLQQHLPQGQVIDFMDVDVEGLDLEVLQTNDWQRFRPRWLMVESDRALAEDWQSPLVEYLHSVGYTCYGKSLIHAHLGNLFFKDTLNPCA